MSDTEDQMQEAFFDDQRLNGLDLSNKEFSSFGARRSVFENCSFENVKIAYGPLGESGGGAVFRSCSFDGADLRGVDPGYGRFEYCSFKDARIKDWYAYCAEFIGCEFATRIIDCTFSGAPYDCSVDRDTNEFRDNDFRDGEMIGTSFVKGIDLDLQKLPQGDEYIRLNDAKRRLTDARSKIERWDDHEKREIALAEIRTLLHEAKEQRDLFLRLDELPKGIAEEFWSTVLGR